MALYTGKGDAGTTKLFTSRRGERIAKSDPIFEALGTVDELNTLIGWCRVACHVDWLVGERPVSTILLDVQHHLFTIQAELAGAEKSIPEAHVHELESVIERIESKLPKITTFFVPGGSELSARLDVARTVARRAERRVVELSGSGTDISSHTLAYVNRLSSLLFALVRFVNHMNGDEEQPPQYVDSS